MNTRRQTELAVRTSEDVARLRQEVRRWATEIGFSLVDQTKVVTAASELARNTVVYGGGGTVHLEELEQDGRRGLRLAFEDRGPGIANVGEALRDGFTTGNGLGLGLGGARRLMNEFAIDSTPGVGTRVVVARWR